MREKSLFPRPNRQAMLLLLAFVLAACAPSAPSPEAASPTEVVESVSTNTSPAETDSEESTATTAAPAATPRGPDLVATDPATVLLAAGELQLVEFFRFT